MSTNAFTAAAQAAAESIWTPEITPGHPLSGPERKRLREGFVAGAEWARDYLAAQEPTDAEVRALGRGLNEAGWTCHEGGDNPGFYDECGDCRRVCDDVARVALAAVRKAEAGAALAEGGEQA